MKLSRPDLAALGLVALCVVGAVVLVALGVPVPDFLTFAGTTALGIAGGAYLPQPAGQENLPPAQLLEQPPAGNLPVAPYPVPLTSEPATGVFRAATHAP